MDMNESSTDPIVHVENMQDRFRECVEHLRKDIEIIEDPKCKALFETSAEVLQGLIKAFEDYKKKNETAWK